VKAAIQSEPLDSQVLASWLVLACIAAVGVLGIGAILVVEASDLAITNTPYKSRSLLHRSLYGDATSSDASVSPLAPPRATRPVKGNPRRRSMKALAISIVAQRDPDG
jgi:hypothetical protein